MISYLKLEADSTTFFITLEFMFHNRMKVQLARMNYSTTIQLWQNHSSYFTSKKPLKPWTSCPYAVGNQLQTSTFFHYKLWDQGFQNFHIFSQIYETYLFVGGFILFQSAEINEDQDPYPLKFQQILHFLTCFPIQIFLIDLSYKLNRINDHQIAWVWVTATRLQYDSSYLKTEMPVSDDAV